MAFEAYRVAKRFQWRGWEFAPAPNKACDCGCPACNGQVGTACVCRHSSCRCDCGIPASLYGGDIWLVEEGHPRKAAMLGGRFAFADASIPTVEDLLKEERFLRLTESPSENALRKAQKEIAASDPHRERQPVRGTVRV